MLITWLISALAIFIAALLIPGIEVGVISALVTAVVLGLLNAFVKPILVALTLPVNVVTLGLFTFVINALIIMLAGAIVPGFKVSGFLPALQTAWALLPESIRLAWCGGRCLAPRLSGQSRALPLCCGVDPSPLQSFNSSPWGLL